MITSCVILNYNDYQSTIKLVNHIASYENINYIVIVDNCSTDNSVKYLSELENKKIKIINMERNGGYGYGNNAGIRYAYIELQSDYVILANPDVIFESKSVDVMIDFLSKHTNYGITSIIAVDQNNNIQKDICWKLPSALEYTFSGSIILKRYFNTMYQEVNRKEELSFMDTDCIVGSLLMMNMNLLRLDHLYDENIFLYCEETVLGIILKKENIKTSMIVSDSYYHLHSVSIDKAFNTIHKKLNLLCESKYYVLKTYYNLSRIKLFFVKLFFKYLVFEYAFYRLVRR